MASMENDLEAAQGDEVGDGSNRYRAPALERGLDVLEALSNVELGLSRAGLAESIGVSVSQIFRMLDVLQRRKYIALDPRSNLFSLTSRLFEMSHRHPPTRRLMALALPIMRAAAFASRQSIHLSVFDDGDALVLAQCDTLEDSGYFVKPGTRRDVFLTASGRVLLAFQNEDERRRRLATSLAKSPGLISEADYLRRLEIVRFQGFEEMPSLQISGVHNLSFPVFDASGHATAAMTLPFLLRTDVPSTIDEARAALGGAAAELSRALGHGGESAA
ncbi:MAG: IclR family transcriptional regulator [Rhizobiaceae bacterium]|nr:IclR family transcriptional regulator [Rhizobiaceae bacterium]